MTQQEFFERTDVKLTAEKYAVVERVYMAAGAMGKDEFCEAYKSLNADGWSLATYLMNEVEKKNQDIKKAEEKITKQLSEIRETAEFLIDKAHAYNDTDFHNVAVSLIGRMNVALTTIELGLPLFDDDKEYIKENLK